MTEQNEYIIDCSDCPAAIQPYIHGNETAVLQLEEGAQGNTRILVTNISQTFKDALADIEMNIIIEVETNLILHRSAVVQQINEIANRCIYSGLDAMGRKFYGSMKDLLGSHLMPEGQTDDVIATMAHSGVNRLIQQWAGGDAVVSFDQSNEDVEKFSTVEKEVAVAIDAASTPHELITAVIQELMLTHWSHGTVEYDVLYGQLEQDARLQHLGIANSTNYNKQELRPFVDAQATHISKRLSKDS